jgi:hypothetical protein
MERWMMAIEGMVVVENVKLTENANFPLPFTLIGALQFSSALQVRRCLIVEIGPNQLPL